MASEQLNILLVGSGGREHALAWKLAQSSRVSHVHVVPGNGGTAALPKVSNNTFVSASDYPGLIKLAKDLNINFAVVGPDDPVVDGLGDLFRDAGIKCFAPSKSAAQLEGSKAFSKDFMARHNIPTAAFRNFTDYDAAVEYVKSSPYTNVVKASGLAAGKGVIIPTSTDEAVDALKQIMVDRAFGSAGDEVVLEEFLEGDELSILTFSDGKTFKSLPPAQDHKRIFEGDQGPNTGGMGCYAPTKIAPPALLKEIDETILGPTIDGMRSEGTPFIGMLFTGLMIGPDGKPKVLEYNTRFGDPETQTLLPLISPKTDFAEVLLACAEGTLDKINVEVLPSSSAVVVVASGGYPGSYPKGKKITISSEDSEQSHVFHAGTALKDGVFTTAGGRVLAVSAQADTLEDAVKKAYEGIKSVEFEGMYFRRDIAHRALKR